MYHDTRCLCQHSTEPQKFLESCNRAKRTTEAMGEKREGKREIRASSSIDPTVSLFSKSKESDRNKIAIPSEEKYKIQPLLALQLLPLPQTSRYRAAPHAQLRT